MVVLDPGNVGGVPVVVVPPVSGLMPSLVAVGGAVVVVAGMVVVAAMDTTGIFRTRHLSFN